LRPSCLLLRSNPQPQRTQVVILQRRVPGLTESALAQFVSRAKHAVRLTARVNVVVTNSLQLRRLNHRFLGKDRATDVLSFPAIRPQTNGFAGDIAISAEIAAQNARRLGHTAREEIKILALHGILHLAGYDHEQDRGEMAVKEARLRKALGLPTGLIERSERLKNRRPKTRKDAQQLRQTRSPRTSTSRALQ